jgi:hypothetical protein
MFSADIVKFLLGAWFPWWKTMDLEHENWGHPSVDTSKASPFLFINGGSLSLSQTDFCSANEKWGHAEGGHKNSS